MSGPTDADLIEERAELVREVRGLLREVPIRASEARRMVAALDVLDGIAAGELVVLDRSLVRDVELPQLVGGTDA